MKKHLFIAILFLGVGSFSTKLKAQNIAEIKQKQ